MRKLYNVIMEFNIRNRMVQHCINSIVIHGRVTGAIVLHTKKDVFLAVIIMHLQGIRISLV
jgi:hypothetical protein